jgi:hypothetical protein
VMATQVKIFIIEANFAKRQFCKRMKVFEKETYSLLRLHLEEKSGLEWPYELLGQ